MLIVIWYWLSTQSDCKWDSSTTNFTRHLMRAKKQNVLFVVISWLETPPSWENRKDASTDSGLGASGQTLVLRRKIKLQESSSSKKQKSKFKNQIKSEQFWYNAQKIKMKPKSTHKRWSVVLVILWTRHIGSSWYTTKDDGDFWFYFKYIGSFRWTEFC